MSIREDGSCPGVNTWRTQILVTLSPETKQNEQDEKGYVLKRVDSTLSQVVTLEQILYLLPARVAFHVLDYFIFYIFFYCWCVRA